MSTPPKLPVDPSQVDLLKFFLDAYLFPEKSCGIPELCGTTFDTDQWYVMTQLIYGTHPTSNKKNIAMNFSKALGKGCDVKDLSKATWYCKICRPDLYLSDDLDMCDLTSFVIMCLDQDKNLPSEEIHRLWKEKCHQEKKTRSEKDSNL